MTMSAPPHDLVIVGAGPVGLTLACEAVRHGLAPRVIDLAAHASIHSKAQIVHARTLEQLEDMGIVERFLERGLITRAFTAHAQRSTEPFARLEIGDVGSRFTGMLSISQHETEVPLAERLRELGVEVERGVELISFTQDEAGVDAVLRHVEDGREERVRAPYLVGCDGAHSTVRHGLDLDFEGSRYAMDVMQTDARVDFPFPVAEDEVLAFITPKGVAGFFPLPGGEHRYRFLVPFRGDFGPKASDEGLSLEHFQELLDVVAPAGSVVSDPRWIVGFQIHCRLASRFRVGRVFLAGDAGHIHSPAGGQGMNMGMQDAYNLAWKLALVHRGEGTEALLGSYEPERRTVAAKTLEWTDKATRGGQINFSIHSDLVVAARNWLAGFVTSFSLVRDLASRLISMVEVAYAESPICGEDRDSVLRANVLAHADDERPTLRARASFGDGPKPGQRAPDAHLDRSDRASARIHERLFGTAHQLLLFDGVAATDEGYAKLCALAASVRARFSDRVGVQIVVPHAEAPAALAELGDTAALVLDPRSSYHEAYAAHAECLYLIRPDGYIGYRSQPANADGLMRHLERILVPR